MSKGFHGHMTMEDGTHVPLSETEAAAIWKQVREADADRKARIPDEKTALRLMMDAYIRLKELGWNDIIYCPKDGSYFDSISVGSTGVHACHYSGTWPSGSWWVADGGDLWPSHPALFRPTPSEPMSPDKGKQ